MDENLKKNIIWAIRIIVAAVFILSAVGKLWPNPVFGIGTFEGKYLGEIGITGGLAKIVSRLLIGLEFSLAILILMPFYLKKIVFPATIGLLAVFSVHLMIQTVGGEVSNCGCFGDLIPMTPLQALIKNLVTISLLILPLTILKNGLNEKKSINPLIYVGLSISLLMFVLIPQGGGSGDGGKDVVIAGESEYSKYFEDINEGNKLLCFFSPTCEHCMETGKVLTELKIKYPGIMPDIRMLFMDEAGDGSPQDIKAYFEFIGAEYSYRVLSIEDFLPVFWSDHNFPGVKYLYNGEERIFFSGPEEGAFDYEMLFDKEKLLEEIKKEY
jgi:thiol-disulfide isomerase/thioredoxin